MRKQIIDDLVGSSLKKVGDESLFLELTCREDDLSTLREVSDAAVKAENLKPNRCCRSHDVQDAIPTKRNRLRPLP